MFQIHSQLINDCHLIGKLDNCHVLLHKNALLHWFILVPETQHKNLLELESSQLDKVMKQAKTINQYLLQTLQYKKTNFASIGNIVEQMHIHIVGRAEDDACWPLPVWGNLQQTADYSENEINTIQQQLITG